MTSAVAAERGEGHARRVECVADGMLTVSEFCELTTMARSTTFEWIRKGRIPVVRLGRKLVIPRRSALNFLAEKLEGVE
jgi:excisionase family DNA binding protein